MSDMSSADDTSDGRRGRGRRRSRTDDEGDGGSDGDDERDDNDDDDNDDDDNSGDDDSKGGDDGDNEGDDDDNEGGDGDGYSDDEYGGYDEYGDYSSPTPEPKVLPKRKNRGMRMSSLVGEEAEFDEQFWGADIFKEKSDDEDFAGDSDDSGSDFFESDFDSDDAKPDAEREAEQRERDRGAKAEAALRDAEKEARARKRQKMAYVDPALKRVDAGAGGGKAKRSVREWLGARTWHASGWRERRGTRVIGREGVLVTARQFCSVLCYRRSLTLSSHLPFPRLFIRSSPRRRLLDAGNSNKEEGKGAGKATSEHALHRHRTARAITGSPCCYLMCAFTVACLLLAPSPPPLFFPLFRVTPRR